MAGVQVLEDQVKVKVLEMVQVVEEMKCPQCFPDFLAQVDPRKMKAQQMLQE